jgi:hypothetical protein
LIKPKSTFLSKNARKEADETDKGAAAALSERERRGVMQLWFSVEAGGLRAMGRKGRRRRGGEGRGGVSPSG